MYPEDVDLQQPPSPSGGSAGNQSAKHATRPKGRVGRPKSKRKPKKSDAEKYTSNVEKDFPLESLPTDSKRPEVREDSVSQEEPLKVGSTGSSPS